MRKPIIAIKLTVRMYSKLADLPSHVIANINSNSATFVTPVPALADMSSALADLQTAITKWGSKGNRGAHADLVDLQLKARILADMLKAEAQYVQITAQATASTDYEAMANIIVLSGFGIANARNPQGTLQKVQNFHQFISRKLNRNEVKLNWKRPLNVTSASNVKQYKVLRNNSTDFSTAVPVGAVTRTTFTDTNATANTVTWTYWIVACNAAGDGVASDPVTVAVLGV